MIHFAPSDLCRHAATDRADLPLEFAHAGFARVVVDHKPQRVFVPFALLGLEAVLFELSPNEIFLRNLELLALGVTGERDDFHPVVERAGNAFDVVRGRDEDDL